MGYTQACYNDTHQWLSQDIIYIYIFLIKIYHQNISVLLHWTDTREINNGHIYGTRTLLHILSNVTTTSSF